MTMSARANQRRAGGRYARTLGTLWRHTKAEQAGDAALGMLLRVWSFCADSGRSLLSKRDMQRIMAGDRNGPRKLKALLDAKLIDEVNGCYTPHDWHEHNPGIRAAEEALDTASGVERDSERDWERDAERESNVTGNVTSNVTCNVRVSDKQNQPLTDTSLRPKTQDPIPTSLRSVGSVLADEVRGLVALADAEFGAAVRAVRVEFCRRYETATGYTFGDAGSPRFGDIARWVIANRGACEGGFEELLARVLDNFFADEWVRKARYPLAQLAKTPDRYAEAGAGVPETPEGLRAAAKAALLAGKSDDAIALHKRAQELEARGGHGKR